jgi:DNA polymerase-3 subunit epsilon
MTTLEKYDWWGSGGKEPPLHLKTKKQLSELGLRPLQPVGVIETRKYNCLLYDPNNLNSVAPKKPTSQKQLETLARNREKAAKKAAYNRWLRDWGWIEFDRVAAVRRAREQTGRDNWVLLDTETTGLEDAEAVEIAIVNSQGTPLLNTLVKPTISLPEGAIAIHGITNEMVKDAPTFCEVYPQIVAALADKEVLIYNANFDIRILRRCCELHKLPLLNLSKRSHCLMEWYAQWVGDWSDYWGNYRYQPLCGRHRALNDCLAALEYLKKMAEDSPSVCYPPGVEPPKSGVETLGY